ncbi:hypothetical protein DRP53_02590 [candidate division WOR-3 bacterium]|uniref:Nucleotidyl transferase domain-containing protein n=1 Tax=candidate division WOR-3 bacterium TaxID=2052148 RepID=A0A660SLZ8_UNCW3|nr:MAG: hypothetical protein DRP53_02590 [candidate division WOR-3 bacterium]
MRPITNLLPKPLFPVGEKTNIDLIIEQMLKTGIGRIGVNLCHLREKLKSHLSPYVNKILLSEEEEILGTGGGIRRIAEKAEADCYLIHNGDVYAEVDLERLIEHHTSHQFPITLVIRAGGSDLGIRGGRVDFDGTGYTYTGIGMIDQRIALNLGRDLIPSIQDIVISGLIYDGPWFDLGSPEGYLNCIDHTRGFISPDAELTGTRIEGSCYIGARVRIRNGLIRNSVILPETTLPDGAKIENAIIAEGSFINR